MTSASLLPTPRKRHRVFGGLNERQERVFTWIASLVVLLFVAGWIGAYLNMRRVQEELVGQQKVAGVKHRRPGPSLPLSRWPRP